jgi:parallel beta-helix repeat protein
VAALSQGNNIMKDCEYYQNGIALHSAGAGDRIEGNQFEQNGYGLLVDSSGNLIYHNFASNNTTNYSIVANNKVGVIVSPPTSTAVSGSTGGAGLGTTDPWANFSF